MVRQREKKSWGMGTKLEPGASTQLIPSELSTDNAYFPKDISNLDIKDIKVPSVGARMLESLGLIMPTLLRQP